MSDVAANLPSSSGPFERAVAAGMSDDLPVPFAELMDPYQTREDLLPWLAAHHSVDLWYDDWPVARKREIIAQYAGVSTIYPGESLPELKGTRVGARRFLEHVEATIVDAIAYPHRPFVGRYPVGRMIIGHPAFRAVYLVGVEVKAPAYAYAVGRHPVGRRAIRRTDFTPVSRARQAVKVAKAEYTEVLLDFSTARVLTAGDAVFAGDGFVAGQYLPRTRLGPN